MLMFWSLKWISLKKNPVTRWEKKKKNIPVLSEFAKNLEGHIKERHVQNISVVGVDLASLPSKQFDLENLLVIESTDLLSHLVLEISYYTKEQFKASKVLEAFNLMAV